MTSFVPCRQEWPPHAALGGRRYPRHIDLQFATLSARHLVDSLRLAGLVVIQPDPVRLTE